MLQLQDQESGMTEKEEEELFIKRILEDYPDIKIECHFLPWDKFKEEEEA